MKNHLVLARKWRPLSFDAVIGQDYVVRILRNSFDSGRIHHAWLFSGTRGVGKTTLSRILAKCLNCEQGMTSSPCCKCSACRKIDSGCFIDYLELDAASNRGIDEMIQLMEQAMYLPSIGRFKVYTIDEAHMLTSYAFNAMLKVLEEPPSYVKFILATTDLSKIPITILSRCLQMNLKQVAPKNVAKRLEYILDQEGISFETSAVSLIAKSANGSLRDALSILDQAILFNKDCSISESIVRDMLGIPNQDYLSRLLEALIAKNAKGIIYLADDLLKFGLSYSRFLSDFSIFLSKISIAQHCIEVGENIPYQKIINYFACQMHQDLVQLFYSITIYGRKDLSLSPDEYSGFLMICFRMISLCPDSAIISSNPQKRESEEINSTQETNDRNQVVPISSTFDLTVAEDTSHSLQKNPIDKLTQNFLELKCQLPDSIINLDNLSLENWPILVMKLSMKGLSSELCEQSELVKVEGQVITIRVEIHMLAEIKNKIYLQNALSVYFGFQIQLNIIIEPVSSFTVHAIRKSNQILRRKKASESLKRDPFVQALMSDFGGKIIPESIQHTADFAC